MNEILLAQKQNYKIVPLNFVVEALFTLPVIYSKQKTIFYVATVRLPKVRNMQPLYIYF